MRGRLAGSEAAIRLRTFDSGIKFPEKFAAGGIQGEYFLRGGNAVQDAVNDDGVGLQAALLAGIEGPCNLKVLDVGAIDLSQRRVVRASGGTTIHRPIVALPGEQASSQTKIEKNKKGSCEFFHEFAF